MIRLALDPGHGPRNVKPTGCVVNTFVEDDFAMEVCRRVRDAIASCDIDASTRILRDAEECPTHDERAKRANEFGADLVMSIHANSHTDTREHGSLCFYLPGDPIGHQAAIVIDRELGRPGEYVNPVGKLRPMRNQVWFASPIDWRGRAYNVIRPHCSRVVLIECDYASHEPSRLWLMSEDGLGRIVSAIVDGIRAVGVAANLMEP